MCAGSDPVIRKVLSTAVSWVAVEELQSRQHLAPLAEQVVRAQTCSVHVTLISVSVRLYEVEIQGESRQVFKKQHSGILKHGQKKCIFNSGTDIIIHEYRLR